MPAARLWRIRGVDAWGGGALELSALHLYDGAGRVDATATLTCSHEPTSGTLAALQDTDPATLCEFAAAVVRAPGFWLQWDFGVDGTADVWGLRAGAGAAQDAFLSTCFLQYFDGSTWVVAECGAYVWPGAGALTAVPESRAAFGLGIGVFAERTSAGSRSWIACASSADGLRLCAADYGGYIYTSTDGGSSWTERASAGSRNWMACASSADGLRLCAVAYGGYIYTSTDGGASWTERTSAGSRTWYSCASSADGLRLMAGASGYIYTSTDGGASWTERTSAGSRDWMACASSADGLRLCAVAYGGYIYTSTDGGASWTERTSAGSRSWRACASSADGLRLMAGASGYIYTSTDGGASWTERTSAGSRDWMACASSADGLRLCAVAYGGYIYTSTDGGASWTERASAGSRGWRACASSADGLRLCAVAYGGYLHTVALRASQFTLPLAVTRQTQIAPIFTRMVGALRTLTAPLQLARDVEVGGPGTIYGTTKTKGTPNLPTKARVVLLHQRSKLPVRETWSDPVTGNFAFTGIDTTQQFLTLAEDAAGNFRPVAANRLTPEVLP